MSVSDNRKLTVQYGDEHLEFQVVPSSSRVESVRISVDPLDGIQVVAPVKATDSEIRSAVRRRAKWISKYYGSNHKNNLCKRAVSGEEVLYLGRRYLLKVIVSNLDSVKMKGGKLVVQTRDCQPDMVMSAVDEWYRQRAKEYFSRRITALFSPVLDKKDEPPKFTVRLMKRQWGSCSPDGKLLLNPLLIRAPQACVDYVIAHELCHLRHHDHGAGFYRLLESRMPDWKERKDFLELVAVQILNGSPV